MSCSINFSNKAFFFLLGFLLMILPGCALLDQQPTLTLDSLDSDKVEPQPAGLATIRWTANISGGNGETTYTFLSMKDNAVTIEQESGASFWEWTPKKPGTYRIKVMVEDGENNTDESKWSQDFTIKAALPRDARIAVLPIDNLSSTKAPLRDIARIMSASLAGQGFQLLDDDTVEQFRKKHRMRYTGGVNAALSQVMQEETGADAFFITSLEAYKEVNPPQISLISRLVSSGGQPEIIWIDSVGLSGDQSPGLLGLNRIIDSKLLIKKAAEHLVRSLAAYFDSGAAKEVPISSDSDGSGQTGTMTPRTLKWKNKYLPYDFFRSPIINPDRNYSIAVIPMLNLAVRKNAGKITSLHYVRELFNLTNFKVIEPGLVREQLLRFRAIMPAGPSLAEADLITSDTSLGVDLVLSGKVFDYQNISNNPKVDFSVQVIEKQSREVVFGARTFISGEKGVFFFDFGKVYTAHNLLEELTRSTTLLLSTRNLP